MYYAHCIAKAHWTLYVDHMLPWPCWPLCDKTTLLEFRDGQLSVNLRPLYKFWTWNCSANSANVNKNNFTFATHVKWTKHVNNKELIIKFWLNWRKAYGRNYGSVSYFYIPCKNKVKWKTKQDWKAFWSPMLKCDITDKSPTIFLLTIW